MRGDMRLLVEKDGCPLFQEPGDSGPGVLCLIFM